MNWIISIAIVIGAYYTGGGQVGNAVAALTLGFWVGRQWQRLAVRQYLEDPRGEMPW